MSAKSDRKAINKCMLQVLNTFVEDDCLVKRLEPIYGNPFGFSITLVGRIQYKPLAKISIFENGKKRTFIFQVDSNRSKVYADDMFPEITFDYRYIEEITEDPTKSKVLYECDRLACSKCNPNCYRTSNVSHAKHFEYENGTWVERIRKDNKND